MIPLYPPENDLFYQDDMILIQYPPLLTQFLEIDAPLVDFQGKQSYKNYLVE